MLTTVYFSSSDLDFMTSNCKFKSDKSEKKVRIASLYQAILRKSLNCEFVSGNSEKKSEL